MTIERKIRAVVVGLVLASGLSACTTHQLFDAMSSNPKLQFDGDSITVQATNDIDAHYGGTYNVAIEATVGTDTLAQMGNVVAQAALVPDVEIIDLGTNDARTGKAVADVLARLDQMAAAFSPATCVIFVTTNSHNPSWGPAEAAEIDAHERSTFAHVADWDAVLVPADFPNVDNPHPNAVGRQHMLQVEDDAIAGCSQPVGGIG